MDQMHHLKYQNTIQNMKYSIPNDKYPTKIQLSNYQINHTKFAVTIKSRGRGMEHAACDTQIEPRWWMLFCHCVMDIGGTSVPKKTPTLFCRNFVAILA